jgi:hypothetical protein
MGTVFYDLHVPDYTADGLAMSGLLVTADSARLQFTAQPDDQLPAGSLPGPATSRRTFSRSDVLSTFAEVYDNLSSRDPQRVEVLTTLTGEDGSPVFSSRETLGGTPGASTRNARIPVAKQIPLKDVRPGRYVLRVEARALGGGAKPALRETTVTVTP